jgi:hypothetical protein
VDERKFVCSDTKSPPHTARRMDLEVEESLLFHAGGFRKDLSGPYY